MYEKSHEESTVYEKAHERLIYIVIVNKRAFLMISLIYMNWSIDTCI